MFHASEACKGKGVLTVKDGEMIFHVSLASKNTLNLYKGSAIAAKDDESNWLKPTLDTVIFDDGTSEEVYGFDIPVEKINTEFDLALIGKKGVWYDHKVRVNLSDGKYKADVFLEGGTGKAKIISPVLIEVEKNKIFITAEWNSKNYDYMIVDGNKYFDSFNGKNSVFKFEVKDIQKSYDVIADTTAMSKPHEIEYKLNLNFIE